METAGIMPSSDFNVEFRAVDEQKIADLEKRSGFQLEPIRIKVEDPTVPEGYVEKLAIPKDELSEVRKLIAERMPTGMPAGVSPQQGAQPIDPKRVGEYVPEIGYALTEQDAKDLKGGIEVYKKLRRQLREMIDLRGKHGSEFVDRVAVERGKQLANEILLGYKNAAKLGVLSKSDEAIINAIIPKDPLEFKISSLGFGEDPVLSRMKAWENDLQQQFADKVGARVQQLVDPEAVAKFEMSIDRSMPTAQPQEKTFQAGVGTSRPQDYHSMSTEQLRKLLQQRGIK
jgi:hypothetical protein